MDKEPITLKQILTINKITNKHGAYIKHLEINEGDKIELTFCFTDNMPLKKQYKLNVKNLRNGIEKNKISPYQLYLSLSNSVEYTENFT